LSLSCTEQQKPGPCCVWSPFLSAICVIRSSRLASRRLNELGLPELELAGPRRLRLSPVSAN
jgi:hypothetical protein